MEGFGQSVYPLFSLFFLFYFPIVHAQLPATQNATMVELSRLLNRTAVWDVNKKPNPCSWEGVICNAGNSSITEIDLSGSSLSTDDFLPSICRIATLEVLDFSQNRLSRIPEQFIGDCGGIVGLRLLNFSTNRLVGFLPTFVGFSRLETLDLSFNMINGSIGVQLNELVSLKSLNLSSNHFNGPVPTNLGRDKGLEQLELSKNAFQGTIPEDITTYVNLTFIDLSENYLSGSLPSQIGDLTKLVVLILSSNGLTGKIPKSLSNITTLVRFAAYQNQFYGHIPDGLTNYVKNLDLSYNHLSDLIPPGLLSQPQLEAVDLSFNRLAGSIPADVSPSLIRLRLGSNMLNGEIPKTLGKLQNLKYLEMDHNSLTGLIPSDLGSCKNLLLLNLAHNNLSGRLPTELGNLQALQVVKLQSNRLSGEIPSEIMQLKELNILNISWNSLNGSIPPSISFLQNLINLNLQGNHLGGFIPNTISNMSSLLELQLGKNQLINPIPQMPRSLQIALNLSSNLFEGRIPKTFSQLVNLEVLDLSNNKFSGGIPVFLTQLQSLTALTLSNNQLSGVVPQFKPWVLFSWDGNPNLKNDNTSNTSHRVAKKQKPIIVVTVAVAAATILSAGLIIFIAILLSRRYYKVNGMQFQSEEDLPTSTVIHGKVLSSNGIHCSNINFAEAMEAVADPSNIEVKTRFSTYFKAIMPSGSSYFVKKLKWSDKIFQLGSHDKFGRELEVLGKLSNSNIMTPLAYVLTIESAYLFYEYAPKGTLFDALHGNLGRVLDWPSRYSIAIGVAQGLAFLHGYTSGPVLLLDLSSKSIFLKSLKEPQIGDIELCKVIDPSKSTGSLSTVAGSVGYIPPEYAYTMRVSPAGNVYSFGVILLELLTGKTAVIEGTELAKTVVGYSKQHQKWQQQILDNYISRTSSDVRSQMVAVLDVAVSCVSPSPEARPKMKTVLRMLLNAR